MNPQLLLAAAPRQQVTGDEHEVGLARGHPIDCSEHSLLAARGEAEVEIREVRDSEAGELGRQPLEGALELFEPHPASLEMAPGESARSRSAGADRDRGPHRATL